MKHILEIAEIAGIDKKFIEQYGNYKAKVDTKILEELKDKPNGKLIFVSAMTATPFGEGKTVTSIGLTQALGYVGKKVHLCLREPSLGPIFGVKGGATGTLKSSIQPSVDINFHFTGDIHAVGIAHNTLVALCENHIYHGNELNILPETLMLNRVLDVSDRGLRHVITGLGGKTNGFLHETGFDITAASEIMAILALANDLKDLKERIGNIMLGLNKDQKPVFAKDLKCHGAICALLKDAIKPNLVQTLEGQPVFVHAGPFANIAHGNSSVIATKIALKLADYVVTEGGFAVDLGAQKFFDIVCRQHPEIKPSIVVIVASLKALKMHGGMDKDKIKTEKSYEAIEKGLINLKRHVNTVKMYGLPAVIAINKFPDDSQDELEFLRNKCINELQVKAEISEVAALGGKGGVNLANAVIDTLNNEPANFKMLYEDNVSLREKIEIIAKKVYHAGNVVYQPKAEKMLNMLESFGFGNLPINIAKTQLSTTDTPNVYGAPVDFTFTVREVRPSCGAKFIVAIAGEMMTMPGLPKQPAALKIDIDENENIIGVE